LNPQPSVLETDALPIELLAYFFFQYPQGQLPLLFPPYLMNGTLPLGLAKLL
jgi:hypothetical protein